MELANISSLGGRFLRFCSQFGAINHKLHDTSMTPALLTPKDTWRFPSLRRDRRRKFLVRRNPSRTDTQRGITSYKPTIGELSGSLNTSALSGAICQPGGIASGLPVDPKIGPSL